MISVKKRRAVRSFFQEKRLDEKNRQALNPNNCNREVEQNVSFLKIALPVSEFQLWYHSTPG